MLIKIKSNDIEKSEKDNGITLVALVITVIIIIILATVTLNFTFGEDGIITKANQAKYMAELSTFQEELGLYKANKQISEEGFSAESITAGEGNLSYVTDDGIVTEGTIYDVITSLRGSSFAGKLEIIKGELLINSQDMEEIRVAQSMGIQVNPYIIIDGELKSDGANLALMDSTGTLTIPDGVTTIGEGAFADLSGLKTIIIPGTVKEIKQNAFKNNTTLENVIIQERDGEGVQYIGDSAFRECKNLKNINLPDTITYIGASAFRSDGNLDNIKLPKNLKELYGLTFSGCSSLKNLELSENLEKLGGQCLSVTLITSLKFPQNLKTIEDGALAISTLQEIDTSENILNIYYTRRNDLTYTVNYLEKGTNNVIATPQVKGNQTLGTQINSAEEVIEIEGYTYDSADKETLTIGTGENIINLYYTKRNDLSYTVNYLEKGTNTVLHEPKTENNQTFGEVITSANEVITIDGYTYDSADKESLTITTGENVINLYYTKRNDLSYTVNYLELGTDEVIHPHKEVGDKTFGDIVLAADEIIDINGYNYNSFST